MLMQKTYDLKTKLQFSYLYETLKIFWNDNCLHKNKIWISVYVEYGSDKQFILVKKSH